ncbi:protein kinase [Trypanosoma theileri]|uniref:Protein kinase n=1 Tax=Trypanosoma theileri TaxID=67003 RepID=A0A1X0NYF8_9TRYP|nr:protein kinase [Trypanosoma theileri]ORC89746.1 protein kinase [Trypanosoma theileri]
MNNYQIYDEIGKGRFSSVYKGRRKKTIEYYAISSIDKSQRQRVLRNVRFLRSAHHHRIIKFHNWYETNNHLWVITELCTGGDLRQVLTLDTCLSEAAVRMYGGDIAEGLMYIHSKGAVYGDLKPSNILMDSTMTMRFYDFGLSCDFSAVRSEGSVGTPLYMAPELFTRDGVPSIASDLWALGCLLCEMITGKPPFEGKDLPSLITNIMTEPFRRQEGLSNAVNDLLEILLVKNPLERATWGDVVSSDLWQGRLQLPTASFPPQPAFERMKRLVAASMTWPLSSKEVKKHVEWVLESAKRNFIVAQSASEAVEQKYPGVAEEIDLRDHAALGESAGDGNNNNDTVTHGQGGRRDSGGNNVVATQSQFVRNRDRMPNDGGIVGNHNNNNNNKANGNTLQDAGVPFCTLDNMRLDELLTHTSDAHIRPLVMNVRIERFVEQKYDPTSLGFDPPTKSELRGFTEQQQAQFITMIYRALSSSSIGYEEKLNILCYFETVCTDAAIANFVVNSSVMTLCLSMASHHKAPSSYRATAISIMSILVRHATFIHTDLAKANILSSLLKVYIEEESPRVKRKLAACIGELLIYIAVQRERDRAVWNIDVSTTFTVYMNILTDADDVLKHYAVKAIENLASVSDCGVAIEIFARPETITALLAIYALPPASTRSDHMRSSALCGALKLSMVKEDLMPVVLESPHLKILSYGDVLTGAVMPKASQSLLTFINMALVKSLVGVKNPIAIQWGKESGPFASTRLSSETSQRIITTISKVAESMVRGLCEGIEHANVAIKGKALILFILLGCIDGNLLVRICSSRSVAYIDSIVRDKDSYVQRCAACLACFFSSFFDTQLMEIPNMMTETTTSVGVATTLATVNVVYNIMSARNFGSMVELSNKVFVSLGACLEKSLSSSRYAEFEMEFNKLVELLAQNSERIRKHRRAVAGELFPPYLHMLSDSNSERRFSALRILSAFVVPLMDVSNQTPEEKTLEGEKLDHVMQTIATSLSVLLKENEPIPIHAIRLLASCAEQRPKSFEEIANVKLIGELVRYMIRSKQSDLSVPLQLLLLALQTERASDIMDFLITQDFINAVLLKTLTMAVSKELDHLLESCCELSAFFLKHALSGTNTRLSQGCLVLLPPQHGLITLWLPLCLSPVRAAAENAAICVYYFVKASTEAQQDMLSSDGIQQVVDILSNTNSNQTAVFYVLRALRYTCERSRKRNLQRLSPSLFTSLETITRVSGDNKELCAEATAIMELIRG